MPIHKTARTIVLCALGSISLYASAATEEGIWSTEDGELSAVIMGDNVLLFEESDLEAVGKIIENGANVQASFPDDGNFTLLFNGDVLLLSQDGDQYQFNKQASRDTQTEAQLDGKWHIPSDKSTKVFIDEGNLMLLNKQTGQMDNMDFGIYGTYWVNLPGPHGMSETALANFSYSSDSLVVEADGEVVLELQR